MKCKKYIFCLLAVSLSSFASNKTALHRNKTLQTLHAEPFHVYELVLPWNQPVEDVHIGDPGAWDVERDALHSNILYLKAKLMHSRSNILITSHANSYPLNILVDGEPSNLPSIVQLKPSKQSVSIQNSATGKTENANLSILQSPGRTHWNFSFAGNHNLAPWHAFDDGHFTYLQFREHQVIPAAFAVDWRGHESLLNTRMEGHTMLILSLPHQINLRRGSQVVAIFNKTGVLHFKARGS